MTLRDQQSTELEAKTKEIVAGAIVVAAAIGALSHVTPVSIALAASSLRVQEPAKDAIGEK